MGGHQSARMGSGVWLTPPDLLGALGRFDLDPCAAPDPRPWPTATRHITLPNDGLAVTWHGRVWLNPPYGRYVAPWLCKMAAHAHGTALVPARTDTDWFATHVWPVATAVLFLAGRVHFHHPDGTRAAGNVGAPSVLVAYGSGDAHRLRASGLSGVFVDHWNTRAGV